MTWSTQKSSFSKWFCLSGMWHSCSDLQGQSFNFSPCKLHADLWATDTTQRQANMPEIGTEQLTASLRKEQAFVEMRISVCSEPYSGHVRALLQKSLNSQVLSMQWSLRNRGIGVGADHQLILKGIWTSRVYLLLGETLFLPFFSQNL